VFRATGRKRAIRVGGGERILLQVVSGTSTKNGTMEPIATAHTAAERKPIERQIGHSSHNRKKCSKDGGEAGVQPAHQQSESTINAFKRKGQ